MQKMTETKSLNKHRQKGTKLWNWEFKDEELNHLVFNSVETGWEVLNDRGSYQQQERLK